jgi:hypothetical protein
MTAEPMTGRLRPQPLAIGLLLFGMLWIAVMLTQDLDFVGKLKAVLLLGLAVAAPVLTWAVEATGGRPPVSARLVTWTVAGLVAIEAFFVTLIPSRLTAAEAVTAGAIVAAPLILQAFGVRSLIALNRLPALLAALCIALAVNRLRIVVGYLHHPDMEDIGRTTIAAVHAVLAGHNPYAAPIDLHPEYPGYPGYKYLPMMIAAYAPLVSAFDEVGLRLTNVILDGALSVAVFFPARRIGGPIAGLLAVIAWLMLPILPPDIYKHGVTDLAPVLPLVVALTISETRLGRAGLLIGLSVAAKLFPGLLVALCCLRRQRLGYYIAGGVVGILPAIAFYLWEPAEFTRNVFLFILSRPMDETSWMFGLPPIVPTLAKLGYFLFLFAVLVYLVVASPGMVRRCGLIVLCVIGALLTGPDAHNNYMIWWAPFFCILLGGLVSAILGGIDRRAAA